MLGDVRGYAFVSSLNAYANWPPGPIGPEDDEPTWTTDDDEYGPNKAYAEREIGAALDGRFLTARAGLIVGPHDPIHRLGWWLDRISRGGRVVVPDALDQPIAIVDARDLADWLVEMAEQGRGGGVNATGPAGMTTLGGLLDICREVTGSDAEWVPVPEEELLDAGVEPWVHLPLWLPSDIAPTAWDVDTSRAREWGLASRPVTGVRRRHVGLAAGEPAPARAAAPPRAGPAARARGEAARRPLTAASDRGPASAASAGRGRGPSQSCGALGRPAGTSLSSGAEVATTSASLMPSASAIAAMASADSSALSLRYWRKDQTTAAAHTR